MRIPIMFMGLAFFVSVTTGLPFWPLCIVAWILGSIWPSASDSDCRSESERSQPKAAPKSDAQLEREFRSKLDLAQRIPKGRWR